MLMQLTAARSSRRRRSARRASGTRAWDVSADRCRSGSRTRTTNSCRRRPEPGTGGGPKLNYAPPVDAIEEFKIGTSSVDASYGRTSGGVVNMTLRSGTNQLRGSGIVLHRGTWLDSNQIQNIRNNISNAEHKYYNVEGMTSGPIRRSKTFFMRGYQGSENIRLMTRTVPTELQRRVTSLRRSRPRDS
jgi:hypothetical protein